MGAGFDWGMIEMSLTQGILNVEQFCLRTVNPLMRSMGHETTYQNL